MKKSSISFIEILSFILVYVPIRLQFFLGDMIGILWFDVLRIRRSVALNNLKLCFSEWTEKERIRVARSSVCHIGRTFIEFMRIPAIVRSDDLQVAWRTKFKLYGEENLQAALAKGHGVFLLSAHVGNGDWATVGLALHNYSVHVISKEIKLRWLNQFWFETRKSLGTSFIPDRKSSLSILRRLKDNAVVVFMLDQFLGPPIGIKTYFFGHETGTAAGLALLAGRSKAAVVPAYSHRTSDGVTHIIFEREIPFVELENKDETLSKMTQLYCDQIETWVRKHPEQWMWVHRRWKQYKY